MKKNAIVPTDYLKLETSNCYTALAAHKKYHPRDVCTSLASIVFGPCSDR